MRNRFTISLVFISSLSLYCDGMKAQSAIEFLATYGFLFIILATAIILITLLATSTGVAVQSQCASFGTVSCNYVDYYIGNGYSLLLFSITNSQAAPVNVISVNATINSKTWNGLCEPGFLMPGAEATCVVNLPRQGNIGGSESGFYTVNAEYCNAGVGSLNSVECSYEPALYSGSFYTYVSDTKAAVFSVSVARVPSSLQIVPYNGVPQIPSGYQVMQNGDLVAASNALGFGYAYGSGGFVGLDHLGIRTIPFPASLSVLSDSAACSQPYNSLYSVAYSVFYVNSPTRVGISAYSNNAIDVYYQYGGSGVWDSMFQSSLWNSNGNNEGGAYVSLASGLYGIAVASAEECGPGVQALAVNGLS